MALALKIGSLTLKTLAKPVASRLQTSLLGHPYTRAKFVDAAQAMHKAGVWISRRAEGKDGKAFIGKMSDEKAVDLAAKIISEGFVYTIGTGLVVYEYNNSKQKEAKKIAATEHNKRVEREVAAKQRRDLLEENARQNMMLREIMERLDAVEAQLQERNDKRSRSFFGLAAGS